MALNYKELGQRIKQYRMARKLSQDDLAAAIAITTGHVSKIETGRRYPSLEIIVSIANTLDITSDDLLVDNLKHSTPMAGTEIHRLLLDCNEDETKMLTRTLEFMKALLTEFGI